MKTLFLFLYRFVLRIICGALIGAFGLTMGYLAYSTLDPLFGVNVGQAALGAALIGGSVGAVFGALYSIPPFRSFIEGVAEAVLNAAT
jgi:uncharacterized membrane protein YjjB (DUF3815 family)